MLVVLTHGMIHFTAGFLFSILPPRSDGIAPFLLFTTLLGVAAVAIILQTDPRGLSRKPHPRTTAAP